MKPKNAKAIASEFETLWREEFAAFPDGLEPLIRDLFVALDGLNDHKPADRRLTWVDASFREEGGTWKAYATPRIDPRKWNDAQALHLMKSLDGFNRKAAAETWAVVAPPPMDKIMDLANAELDAIRDGKSYFDGEVAMAVEAFALRWQDFENELAKAADPPASVF